MPHHHFALNNAHLNSVYISRCCCTCCPRLRHSWWWKVTIASTDSGCWLPGYWQYPWYSMILCRIETMHGSISKTDIWYIYIESSLTKFKFMIEMCLKSFLFVSSFMVWPRVVQWLIWYRSHFPEPCDFSGAIITWNTLIQASPIFPNLSPQNVPSHQWLLL